MRYIGVLQAAAEDAEAEAVPVVADPVPVLEFVEVLAGPSAVELRPQQSAPPTKRQPQIWKTHYVCTGKGCGWSGSARTRHAERRPNCPFVPCPLRFRAGEKPLVKEYLAQCTEAQARLAPPYPVGREQESPPPTPTRSLLLRRGSTACHLTERERCA